MDIPLCILFFIKFYRVSDIELDVLIFDTLRITTSIIIPNDSLMENEIMGTYTLGIGQKSLIQLDE